MPEDSIKAALYTVYIDILIDLYIKLILHFVECDHVMWCYMQEHSDESVYFEAFDKVLESWMKFVQHEIDLPTNILTSHAVEIFNTFIHCHLAQPDGSRSVVNISLTHFTLSQSDCDYV